METIEKRIDSIIDKAIDELQYGKKDAISKMLKKSGFREMLIATCKSQQNIDILNACHCVELHMNDVEEALKFESEIMHAIRYGYSFGD